MKIEHNTAPAEFPDSSVILAGLIDAKIAAEAAHNTALDQDQAMEDAYFAAHPEREIVIPLEIGGALSFGVRFDLEQYRDDWLKELDAIYDRRRDSIVRVLATIISEDDARAKVDEHKANDIRKIGEAYVAAQASRDAFGYGQAIRDRAAMSDADMDALYAVCGFRCTTPQEYAVKAAFLLAEHEKSMGLAADEVEALLKSMMPEGQEGGDA